MEYYLSLKNKNIQPFATTWMKLEDIMLTEISQTQKEKKSHNFTYIWSLKTSHT